MSHNKRTKTSEDDFLSQFIPKSFGNSSSSSSSFNLDTRKRKVLHSTKNETPAIPSKKTMKVYQYGVDDIPEDEESEEEKIKHCLNVQGDVDEDIEEDMNPYNIPYKNEVFLKDHIRPVSTLALDHHGVRLLTGSHDCTIKFWDFNTMDASFKPFRSIEPFEGYSVHKIRYSRRSDCMLVAATSPHIKLLDREGREIAEFEKGYQYITDMSNTNGHTQEVTNVFWHPKNDDMFITSSFDSTVRLWNVNNTRKQQTVIKIKNKKGLNRAPVTAFAFDEDFKTLVCGSSDGSLHLYDTKGNYNKAKIRIFDAHEPDHDISSMSISSDGYTLLSRSTDDTLKVWDIRKFKQPLKVFDSLPNKFRETTCLFSPNDQLIVTGTSTKSQTDVGKLVFIDKYDLKIVKSLDISSESVIDILWHPTINQIICGCADNQVHVLFDEFMSVNGALQCVSKAPRKKIDFGIKPEIYSLESSDVPLFVRPEPRPEDKLRRLLRKEPVKYKKPEEPHHSGPGSKGNLGTSIQSEFMKKLINNEVIAKDEDPREVIFKYARETSELKEFYNIKKDHNPLDYEGLKKIEEEERKRLEEEEEKKK